MSSVAESTEIVHHLRHISPSGISRFVRCPESFRRNYILGEKERAGFKALLGSADSHAYETYLRARMAGVRLPLDQVEDDFRDHVMVESEKQEWDWDDKGATQTPGGVIDLGLPTVRAYFPTAEALPEPVAVEEDIRIEYPSLPIPIVGRLDFELPAVGVDRKNVASKGVDPSWRLQNRIYSAAKAKPWSWHLTTRTRVPAVWTPENGGEAYETPWSEATAVKTMAMVGQVLGQIEGLLLMRGPENPWPQHGYLHQWACSHCSYKRSCPAWS